RWDHHGIQATPARIAGLFVQSMLGQSPCRPPFHCGSTLPNASLKASRPFRFRARGTRAFGDLRLDAYMSPCHGAAGVGLKADEARRAAAFCVGVAEERRLPAFARLG